MRELDVAAKICTDPHLRIGECRVTGRIGAHPGDFHDHAGTDTKHALVPLTDERVGTCRTTANGQVVGDLVACELLCGCNLVRLTQGLVEGVLKVIQLAGRTCRMDNPKRTREVVPFQR